MQKLTAKILCGYMLALLIAAGISLAPKPVSAVDGVCQCPGVTCNASSGNCPTLCTLGDATANKTECGSTACPGGQGTCVPGQSGTVGTGTGTGATPSGGKLENPLSSICSDKTPGQQCVQLIIGNVIKAALGIVGSIALLMMTYGGFLWLTAMGNSERIEKGKNTLIWAVLGLTVIFGAYAVTSYIIDKIVLGK
jgi:hypothetical protein